MKHIHFLIIIFFLTLHLNCFSQYGGCNQSTLTVDQVFYPATSTVYTSSVSMEVLYLCGPNTVVYDTAYPYCRQVLLQANTMYITNSQGCVLADFIYAKSTSTVLIKANGNPGTFRVIYELGATIIDQTGNAVTFTCSSLSFPTINCSVGIKTNDLFSNEISFFPNPATDKIYLTGESINLKNEQVLITNTLGQIVLKQSYSNEIDINTLAKGIYFLSIKGADKKGFKFVKE
jgi:hypothetical protein